MWALLSAFLSSGSSFYWRSLWSRSLKTILQLFFTPIINMRLCGWYCLFVCFLFLTRTSSQVFNSRGLVRVTLRQAFWRLCLPRMWTVLHSFWNVYPEASSFLDCFSSSEQKQLLICWILSPFSFLCNSNFEENFKIQRKDVRPLLFL